MVGLNPGPEPRFDPGSSSPAGCGQAGAAETQSGQAANQAPAAVTTNNQPAGPPTVEAAASPATASAGDTLPLPAAPVEIGEIVFAPEVTANREPVNPDMFGGELPRSTPFLTTVV